ncbi:MAG: hypothetical protein HKP57_02450 [Halobacteria archaeon]|nr:hypothetical protein [Halobacteria archaeon]
MNNPFTGQPRSYAWLVSLLLLAGTPPAAADFDLRMQTDLGALDIRMLDSVAPLTVANFMNYVDRGDYDGTFIHRSVSGFVIQGGGYTFDNTLGTFFSGGTTHIPEDPPVVNEFNLSNLRATLAMAKLGSNPDSATSEFFFNLADNSANLDAQNGGFTVFAQVQGTGMTVVDDIAALPICPDVAPSFICSAAFASQVPLADTSGTFDNSTLVNMYVGADNDGDGAIDRLEDAAPVGGDANNDMLQDSTQAHVAGYPVEGGEFVVVESNAANPLAALAHMDASFNRANPAGTYELLTLAQSSGMSITRGYAGFNVTGLAPGGATTVTVTLPAGDAPDTFFNYGPTPSNQTPHWYVFDFDGTTGAQIAGNVLTLHFVDGLRGDADLDASNGLITGTPGGAGLLPADLDGVSDVVEDGALNGDGNSDGTDDKLQDNVASLPDINANYVTMEALQPGHTLHYVESLDGSTLGLGTAGPPLLAGNNFENGFFEMHVANVAVGGSAEIRIILPPGSAPDSYFMFGPEPGNATDHWYLFDFDAASGTGAVINGNEVILHLVDGGRGDADLVANGIIADPGGPAVRVAIAGPKGSSGCALLHVDSGPLQAGAWWLILLLGMGYAGRRSCRR